MRALGALAAVVAVAAIAQPAYAAGRCGDPAQRPWCDTSLGPDERADLLLAELTEAERISLLAGDELFGIAGAEGTHTGTSDGVARVGLPTIYFSDGPAGPRSGKATALPAPIALGATWDPRMARLYAGVVANEVRAKGNDVVFAPTVDIVRTPLAGRAFEGYGEDPVLTTRLAVPWTRTAQSRGLIATVKHYTAYHQEGTGPLADLAQPGMTLQGLGIYATEGSRMRVSANVDERTLRELYLPPFEAVVTRANAGAVMCSYNRINGTYACEHPGLLEELLRGDLGFEGFVIADYGGAHRAAESLRAGLDFEPWPGVAYSPASVQAALLSGGATMADVDRHVHRYLRTLFAYGAMDREPYPADEALIDKAGNADKARRIAEAGTVLLRNDGLLPLRAGRLDSIAIIGDAADEFLTGGGSSEIDPFSYTTPLAAIERRAGPGVRVVGDDGADPERAAAVAAAADVAIVVAPAYLTEGIDRRCLSLDCPPVWGDQDALIEAVAAANPRTAVVLESGAPVLTPWRARVGAVLSAWYPGSEGGTAIARILFGDTDPGGRLPVTFPETEADLPTAGDPRRYPGVDDEVSYSEGVLVGHRWYDEMRIRPAFAFGHGLSYTRFRFHDLTLRAAGRASGAVARVSAAVTNSGRRRGVAVPQLYLRLPERAGIEQPPRALKGFRKLRLVPGKTRRVRFALNRRALAHWDAERDRWRLARGCYRVFVGRSSRRLPLRGTLAVGKACGAGAVRIRGRH